MQIAKIAGDGLMYYVKDISGALNLIACYNKDGTLNYKNLWAFTTTAP